jgi:hypothetical protein
MATKSIFPSLSLPSSCPSPESFPKLYSTCYPQHYTTTLGENAPHYQPQLLPGCPRGGSDVISSGGWLGPVNSARLCWSLWPATAGPPLSVPRPNSFAVRLVFRRVSHRHLWNVARHPPPRRSMPPNVSLVGVSTQWAVCTSSSLVCGASHTKVPPRRDNQAVVLPNLTSLLHASGLQGSAR